MKMTAKSVGGVPFARKAPYTYEETQYAADLQHDDLVTILDAGVMETGKYGDQQNFKIMTRNGEKKASFNQSTVNVLIQELGDDSDNWVNKEVRVIIKKDFIAGKKVDIAYFVTGSWSLDEYRLLCKHTDADENTPGRASQTNTAQTPPPLNAQDSMAAQSPVDVTPGTTPTEEIKVEDIPF